MSFSERNFEILITGGDETFTIPPKQRYLLLRIHSRRDHTTVVLEWIVYLNYAVGYVCALFNCRHTAVTFKYNPFVLTNTITYLGESSGGAIIYVSYCSNMYHKHGNLHNYVYAMLSL